MSERRPLHDCHREKPELNARVRLTLENQQHVTGRWNGTGWFSEGREVEPVYWQYVDAAKHTH